MKTEYASTNPSVILHGITKPMTVTKKLHDENEEIHQHKLQDILITISSTMLHHSHKFSLQEGFTIWHMPKNM